ncbi:MAG: AraC family transcriptional regulator [Bacteroidota bacterium]|nr:AraC family transcriptional regulator [Bacteroidota bacterium]MDX5431598.1 AraC family transcriptional regulator [Bacteroidota bacterium]MDX5470319.1 AraC family transcriptional regulator [Bacteroidota bacterium]
MKHNTFKEQLDAMLQNNLHRHLNNEELAKAMNLSKSSFQRRCKEHLQDSASDYQLGFTVKVAENLLKEGHWQVNEISDRLLVFPPPLTSSVALKKYLVIPQSNISKNINSKLRTESQNQITRLVQKIAVLIQSSP